MASLSKAFCSVLVSLVKSWKASNEISAIKLDFSPVDCVKGTRNWHEDLIHPLKTILLNPPQMLKGGHQKKIRVDRILTQSRFSLLLSFE
jgi:hypothetical protein